ncbi:MAG TPA: hypothetical protein VFS02_01995 [Telluria sp.]|nr:hypothetical protein [Telluria sp.]
MDSLPRNARPWLGAAVVAIAVFATCWTASVVYWRASGSTPSGMAVGQLLLGLPVAILLAAWLGRTALQARAAPAATQPAAAALPAAAPDRGALPHIAAAAVRLRGGDCVDDLAEALRANAVPCELDSELTDDAGYPIFSGRIDTLDADAARDDMLPWLAQRGMAELRLSDEQWRALAMGGAVAAELAQHALLHPLLPDYLAAAPADRGAIALPKLELKPVLSAAWLPAQRQAAGDWLLHLVAQQGWPATRLQLSPAFDSGPSASFSLVGALAHAPGLTLLVACESFIGDDSVRDWSERGLLYTGRTPRGQVPGEGAAGLLLADDEQAALLAPAPMATLHGACDGQREHSADARGNINSDLLAALGRQALHEGQIEAAAITALCADADLRPSRAGELMGMASAVLPELDLASQMISAGACCGSAGAVGPLAALALAWHEAIENGGQVLCVSNTDSHYRSALLVRRA